MFVQVHLGLVHGRSRARSCVLLQAGGDVSVGPILLSVLHVDLNGLVGSLGHQVDDVGQCRNLLRIPLFTHCRYAEGIPQSPRPCKKIWKDPTLAVGGCWLSVLEISTSLQDLKASDWVGR